MSNEMKVTVNQKKDTVKLTIQRRDTWGRVGNPKQYTFSRRHFELMLRKADIVIPWDAR